MLVALMLYARARGNQGPHGRSSGRVCAYRLIAAQSKPDRVMIARFVERHQDAVGDMFGEGSNCAPAGLVG